MVAGGQSLRRILSIESVVRLVDVAGRPGQTIRGRRSLSTGCGHGLTYRAYAATIDVETNVYGGY